MGNLCTLANVKEYAGISGTAYDARITALLAPASRAVEKWCGREFESTARVEYYDGVETWAAGCLSLRHMPVISVSRLAIDPTAVMTVNNTDTSTNQRATVAVSSSALTLTRVASGTTPADSTLSFSTYATLTDLHDAIEALGNGWTAEVTGDADDYGKWQTSLLKYTQGALSARGQDAELMMHVDEPGDWRLDSGDTHATIYGYFPRGFQNVEVRYTSGYTTVPDPVTQGAICVVTSLFRSSDRDFSLKSERIGDYAYTTANPNEIDLSAPVFADARFFLNEYRRIRAL